MLLKVSCGVLATYTLQTHLAIQMHMHCCWLHYDTFLLAWLYSSVKDDLIFSGVIAIVWEESKADGNFVHTKSMLINSITTVRSIINQCIGKFHLPGSSLSYGIYESNSHTKCKIGLHWHALRVLGYSLYYSKNLSR